jgi:uncharacterized protein
MSDSPTDKLSALIKCEDAPAFGGGSMPVEKEKTMVMLAHLFSIIVWPLMRKRSPAVDAHGKEALNFAITGFIPLVVVQIILGMILPASLIMIVSIVVGLVGLACLALVIIAMLKAKEGKLLRYPINLRLIK